MSVCVRVLIYNSYCLNNALFSVQIIHQVQRLWHMVLFTEGDNIPVWTRHIFRFRDLPFTRCVSLSCRLLGNYAQNLTHCRERRNGWCLKMASACNSVNCRSYQENNDDDPNKITVVWRRGIKGHILICKSLQLPHFRWNSPRLNLDNVSQIND